MSEVLVITDNQFEAEVLKSEQPVLVYFWASWCGPCRLMAPVISTVASERADQLKIVKMEVDPNPEAVAKYQVQGVPALRLFIQGQLVESAEGAMSPPQVAAVLDKHLSSAV